LRDDLKAEKPAEIFSTTLYHNVAQRESELATRTSHYQATEQGYKCG